MHGAISMAGRKNRKSNLFVVREPSGRRSRAGQDEIENCSPAQVRRLRDAALQKMCDPDWGTELGRLYLTGRLNVGQYAAGKWFGRLSEACRAAIDAPTGPRKSAFVEGNGGHAPDPDSDAGREQVTKDREAVSSFMEAHAALLGAGMLAEHAVRLVCEDNKTVVGHAQVLHLRSGLDWLAEYRALTIQNKHGRSSK